MTNLQRAQVKIIAASGIGLLLVLNLPASAAEAKPNLCENPGFERLNPAGDNFPINWSGTHNATIDKAAHTGSIALRLTASPTDNAGVNSQEISARRGVVRYWYKAMRSSVDGDNLRMFVIGVTRGKGEITRTGLAVPAGHVGDGQWHQAALQFDFSTNPAINAVLISPRVNEQTRAGEGEWLLDDFELEENRLGPRAEIEALYMADPVLQKGQPTQITLAVINNGDEPVPPSKIRLLTTEGARAVPAAPFELTPLAPGESRRFTWDVMAMRKADVRFTAQWSAAEFAPNTIVIREYPTACIEKADPRALCTTKGGFWRFMPEPAPLQEGNTNLTGALPTKRSAQLPDSVVGVTAHVPRSRDLEVIFEPQHLIDGNPDTNWSARAHQRPVAGGVDWARIDFARPAAISEIRLVPYWHNEGFPIDFTVSLLLEGNSGWKIIHRGQDVHLAAPTGDGAKTPYVIKLDAPVPASALRVEVTRCSVTSNFFTEFGLAYYFRLSEIEAIAAPARAGEPLRNVAAAAGGAKVSVSTTFRSYFNSKEVVRSTYEELFNLGVKWNRIGQWGDWTCWSAVEQKKGEYHIDPTTDAAITESIRNGVQILYTLDYGNPLYESTPPLANNGPVWHHGHPFLGHGGPTREESIRGFVNYARFVAKRFKGRVKYYEVWNEENSWAWYGSPPDPKAFGTLVRETAKALKEIDPEIKVMTGGTAALAPTFISDALRLGEAGPFIDAVAFHPYTMPFADMGVGSLDVIDGKQQGKTPEQLGFKTWPEMLGFLRKTFAPYNNKLEFWANEWNAIPDAMDGLQFGIGEITEAKHAARFYLSCALTDVHAVWWSLANQNYHFAWAILRTDDLSRKPVYYTIQAMATLLAGMKADPASGAKATGDATELRCESMVNPAGERLIAVWTAVTPQEDSPTKRVTLRIPRAAGKTIELIDTLHATIQRAVSTVEGDDAIITGLLAVDYPIIAQVR